MMPCVLPYILIPFPSYKMTYQNKVHKRHTFTSFGWADAPVQQNACCRQYLRRTRVQHFDKASSVSSEVTFFIVLTRMFIGIFKVLLLKVQQSQWIPPTSMDPDLDSAYLYFGEFFLFLLEYTFAMYSQC